MADTRLRWTQLLTHDFCPWLNRWVYWIKHPIVSLCFAGIAAGLCAAFVKTTALVGAFLILAVVLIGCLWPWISIAGVSAQIKVRQRKITEGDSVRIQLFVTNRWPWPVWGLLFKGDLLPLAVGESAAMSLPVVAGRASTEFEWNFTPQVRGEYPGSRPQLVTSFPFGLRQASRGIDMSESILVWPKLIPLETLLDAAQTRPADESFSETRVGPSGDMIGTRPFRNGDSLRRVHWAQTARHGQFIVRELQDTVQASIRVVFDSDPRMHHGSGTSDSLEWSIRIAASVCSAYHRQNAEVECCFGHETISLKQGSKGLSEFLDRLSRWKPCRHDANPNIIKPASGLHSESRDASKHQDQDCFHHHSQHDCRRIHHRNCGRFQLTITTELGLTHRTEHRHVHGDQRWIVLTHPTPDHDCPHCDERHRPPNSSSIVVESADTLPAEFRRHWRHVCHAG